MTGLEVTRPLFVIPAKADRAGGLLPQPALLRQESRRQRTGCESARECRGRTPCSPIVKDLNAYLSAGQAGDKAGLKFYTNERPHQGNRNMGSRPIVTVRRFIQPVRKEA